MNIQISNININKINPALVKKYFMEKKNMTLVFSEANILELRKDGLWRIDSKDVPITSCIVGKHEMLIDKSKWIKEDEYYQIPTNHLQIKIVHQIYKLNKKSLLKLIIEEENSCITNVFFKTDEVLDVDMIKKDMISFLSCLKLC